MTNTKKTSKKRIPTLIDRGHGIGRHSYNNTIVNFDKGGFQTVYQTVVSNVWGEQTARYNWDTGVITSMDVTQVLTEEQAPWTWAQVREVVLKDLRSWNVASELPASELVQNILIASGGYGSFEKPTIFGLYHGKRPSWMSKEEWDRRKAGPTAGSFLHPSH